jgi:CheY-like chemotaxis protein
MPKMPKLILHVEDEEDDAFLFRRALIKTGGDVPIQVASDGQKAIEYLQGSGGFANREEFPLPSLVLLDLKLPHVPGLEVLKWIRQQAALSIPVVVLSSSESEDDIAAAYELGANAYLVKPSDTSELPDIAKTVKDFWLTRNRTHPNTAKGTGRAHAGLTQSPGSRTPPAQ